MLSRVTGNPVFAPPLPLTEPESWAPVGLSCAFLARALYTRRGCRDIQEFNVEVFEISRRHLRLRSPLTSFLPPNFTLVLGAAQYGIGCSVVKRSKNAVLCNLIRRESGAVVSYLTTRQDARETLLEINDPLFPKARTDRKQK